MNEKLSGIAFYIILIVTAFCFIPLKHLKLDLDAEKFYPAKDPEVLFFNEFKKQFHSQVDDEVIIIGLENSSGIFQKEFLEKADSLTKFITKLDHITKVYSLTNSSCIYFKDGQFNARPLIHISQPEFYAEDSINLFESREFRDLLISKSGRVIAIAAFNAPDLGDKEKDVLLHSIKEKINQLGFGKTHLTGKIKIERTIAKEVKENLIIFLPILFLIICLSLLLLYGSFRFLLIPLLTIIISNIWTLSLMTVLGYNLDIISCFILLVLTSICIVNSIYFTSSYINFQRSGSTQHEALQKAIKNTWSAILLSSFAAAIIFIAIAITDIIPVKTFGLFAGTGILLSSLMLRIFILSNSELLPDSNTTKNTGERWQNILSNCFNKVIRNKYPLIVVFSFLVLLSGYFIIKIEINGKLLDKIPKHNSLLEDYKFVENDFYGTRRFEMALLINESGKSFMDLSLLKKVEEVEIFLRDSCKLAHIISPISLFKGANKAYRGGSNAYFTLADTQEEINTYAGNIMQTQYAEEMQRYLLTDGSSLRISGRLPDLNTKEFYVLKTRFESYFKSKEFGSHFTYKITGDLPMFEKVSPNLVKYLIIALIIALLFLSFLGVYLMRSWVMLIVVMVPVLISMLLIAGVMGMLGIHFTLESIVIFSLTFAITANNIFYFLISLKGELKKGRTLVFALESTYLGAGKAIILSSLVLMAGFLGLFFSSLGGAVNIGVLTFIGIFCFIVLSLTALPILLFLLYQKKGQELITKSTIENI